MQFGVKELFLGPRRLMRRIRSMRGAGSRSPRKLEALRMLRDRGVRITSIVDVGVLHGTPELVDVFSDLPHILFEPVTECASQIERVYRNIDYTLVQKAVGDRDGHCNLRIRGEAGALTSSAHVERVPGEDVRPVELISLDTFCAQAGPIEDGLLKIDTDGHEEAVLRGGREFVGKCSVVIIESTNANINRILELMFGMGFLIFDIVEPCYYDGALWQVDIIFIRKDVMGISFDTISDKGVDFSKYEIFK